MQAAFGIEPTPTVAVGTQGGPSEKSMAARPAETGKNTDYLAALLRTKIDAEPALAEITVTPLSDKVALELPIARISTESGAAGRPNDLLFALAGMLAVIANDSALVAELPASTTGENWTQGMALANALSQRLRDSGDTPCHAAGTLGGVVGA